VTPEQEDKLDRILASVDKMEQGLAKIVELVMPTIEDIKSSPIGKMLIGKKGK
jgi:hypothetical protein